MKNRWLLLLFLSIQCALGIRAQNVLSVGNSISVDAGMVYLNTASSPNKFRPNESLTLEEGSYLLKDWYRGYVITSARQKVNFDKMNYNVETGEMEVQRNGKQEFFSPTMVRGFVIMLPDSTQNLFFAAVPTQNKNNPYKYYQVLTDGKVALLWLRTVDLKQGNYNPILKVGEKAKLVVSNSIYSFDGKQIQKVKHSKKGILKILTDKTSQLEEFITQNKITDFDDYDNIKKIFDYYNKIN